MSLLKMTVGLRIRRSQVRLLPGVHNWKSSNSIGMTDYRTVKHNRIGSPPGNFSGFTYRDLFEERPEQFGLFLFLFT